VFQVDQISNTKTWLPWVGGTGPSAGIISPECCGL